MSLLNFFKKSQKPEGQPDPNNILLAMPIFNDNKSYEIDKIIGNLKTYWGSKVDKVDGNNEVASFSIDGETIAIAFMPMPIPSEDIKGTAQYAYNWPSALNDLKEHTGHAIVSVMAGQKSPLERFRILSKILSSILVTSEAVAIYQGSQSLLIPRQQYLAHAEELLKNSIPVMLWVYIGLKKSSTGNSVYTYGLKDFNKKEIEIIDSNLNLEQLFDLIFDITSYVIKKDATLNDGETIGLTADQKIPIKLSKGQLVEGQSLKLSL